MQVAARGEKGYKGLPMEGPIARWYAGLRGSQSQIEEYRRQASQLTAGLPDGAAVLEVAPGPGYFAIEVARSGRFRVTGLDISRSFVRIAGDNARRAGVEVDFRLGDASSMPFSEGTSSSPRRRSRTSAGLRKRSTRCTGCCGWAARR
jgi:predicted methyltransferase